jgi:hypothetical protein
MKKYLALTLVISILFGILLPLVLGVKDPMLIATTFSMVWVIYAIMLLVTVFPVKPGLNIKASRKNGVTVVRYELPNPWRKKYTNM